ncbi:MAG TPA: hypothetical protein VKY19_26190 [Ktedonosporobacter sp.]|jgi:hypothetical protein|nr:hypothetical protein [Ktedonosporobacter sp.]
MAGSQNNETLLYPIDHMSQVAAQILVNASTARLSHDTAWGDLQTYIANTFAPEWQTIVINLIKPYMDHLRSSYDWQIDLASAIFDATDLITGTDKNIANQFDAQYHGHHGF